MKGATEELFDKVTYYKRERALGALNGTLLRVSLSASHSVYALQGVQNYRNWLVKCILTMVEF